MFNWLGAPEMHLNIYMKKPKALGTRQTLPLVSGEARYTPGRDPRGVGGWGVLSVGESLGLGLLEGSSRL